MRKGVPDLRVVITSTLYWPGAPEKGLAVVYAFAWNAVVMIREKNRPGTNTLFIEPDLFCLILTTHMELGFSTTIP